MSKSLMEEQLLKTISRDLGLDVTEDQLSYQELLDAVSDQVSYYLRVKPETLFSLLYRLDVQEHNIENILTKETEQPKNLLIAELIIHRQIERIESKKKYKQQKIEGWDEY